MSLVRRGWLQARLALPSYLDATRVRYHLSRVSGVTNVSIFASACWAQLGRQVLRLHTRRVMSEPLCRIVRRTSSTGYRVVCVASLGVAVTTGVGVLCSSALRAELGILSALSWLVSGLTLQGLVFPSTIEVVLLSDRVEWGVVGRSTRDVVYRCDVKSVLLGTGLDHDITYVFLRDGTKVEVDMFGGFENIQSLAAAIRQHWPDTLVKVDEVP